MSDIHPTVQAAAKAMSRHATSNGYRLREERTPLASIAVGAAFRERAEHVINTCEDKTYGSRYPLRCGWMPCAECDGVADMLTLWADEIEGATDGTR